jgi:hypothetical protein
MAATAANADKGSEQSVSGVFSLADREIAQLVNTHIRLDFAGASVLTLVITESNLDIFTFTYVSSIYSKLITQRNGSL